VAGSREKCNLAGLGAGSERVHFTGRGEGKAEALNAWSPTDTLASHP